MLAAARAELQIAPEPFWTSESSQVSTFVVSRGRGTLTQKFGRTALPALTQALSHGFCDVLSARGALAID